MTLPLLLDAWYTIGRLHLFCEDYACQGKDPVPHLILSDGCSAVSDSDLGARLLVLTARRLLPQFIRTASCKDLQIARHWQLGRRIIRNAARSARALGIPSSALDATLLIAWCEGETVHIHFYGDGCIITRNQDGALGVLQIEYADNTPYYLSYLLQRERHTLYREAIGDPQISQTVRYMQADGERIRQVPFDTPTVFSFRLTTFPTIALATDGLHSFVNLDSGERIGTWEVARALLEFSNFKAGFVKRRTCEVLAEYGRQHIMNLDDLGWGAFIKGDDQ